MFVKIGDLIQIKNPYGFFILEGKTGIVTKIIPKGTKQNSLYFGNFELEQDFIEINTSTIKIPVDNIRVLSSTL
jgi:hypothetical protein